MASELDRLRGLRILVVEDTFMLADELNEFLLELGCEVVGPAARAQEAAELAREGTALDGALLDVNLSRGETSFSVAADLASHHVPFVFVTGYDLESSFPPEFRGVPRISKPLDLNKLVHTMLRHFAPASRLHG
jgi:CheY-like chemotaxis protein